MSVLTQIQEHEGFWLPNDIIDKCFPLVGVRGLGLYCLLARCEEQGQYPTIATLSRRTRMSQLLIRTTLGTFHSYGLLNDSDLKKFNITLSEVQSTGE